tara:strand:- start:670 stop:1206 length:537 start_codon:yes stop_codon:yes gene_type:complete
MKNWIGHYKNIIDDAGCKSIINYPWDWYASTYSNNKGVVNNSEERVRMDECWCSDTHKPYPLLKNSVIEVMNIYAKEHDRFSCVHHTDFRLNRYGVDGFMSPHCDNIHHSHGQTYGYPQATVLFFLNDDYEGGDFYVAEEKYTPETGSALIFPSNFMFPHEVKKVTKGERWSIVTWLM